MNLALTEDQILIRDAAESFLGDVSTSAAVRAAMESAAGYDDAVWQRIGAELGWCALPIPEDCGGLGLSAVELTLVLEQMGRRLLCAPFFSTVCLAANLINETARDDARRRFLGAIAEGSLSATTPLPSSIDWRDAATELEATPDGEGWKLNGHVARVPDGANVGWLFMLAKLSDGGHGLFALRNDDEGLAIQQLNGWDQTRRFARLDLDAVSADRIDDPAKLAEGLPRAAALARLYLAAEQLGAAQTCLDLTVAYTATRKQFGRVIASFQAVKHRCAEMMVRVEELRSAVAGASAIAAASADLRTLTMECAMARALAADTAFWCAQEAIQLHGGVGFTWEYDPQLYFKRAQAASHWLGTADALREQIAAEVMA